MVPIIRQIDGDLHGDMARWGLIPHFHRGGIRDWKANTINARIETVTSAPSFRGPYRTGRCILPVSGYYEWATADGSKRPHYIHPAGNAPALIFAGLWSSVRLPDYEGLTCTIITEPARPALATIHDRQPVMIEPDTIARWLGGGDIADVPRLPTDGLAWHAVGKAVGSVRNEGPELIEAV